MNRPILPNNFQTESNSPENDARVAHSASEDAPDEAQNAPISSSTPGPARAGLGADTLTADKLKAESSVSSGQSVAGSPLRHRRPSPSTRERDQG